MAGPVGLQGAEAQERLDRKLRSVEEIHELLRRRRVSAADAQTLAALEPHRGGSFAQALRDPTVTVGALALLDPALASRERIYLDHAETDLKYDGYLSRQEEQVLRYRRMEERHIPTDFDWDHLSGVSSEAREKLKAIRPMSRGPGIPHPRRSSTGRRAAPGPSGPQADVRRPTVDAHSDARSRPASGLQPGEVLRRGLEQLGAPDPGAAQALLDRYLDELQRWNERFGLVGTADRGELVVRHVLDSLGPWRLVSELAGNGRILDVGSGAGFPGLPLAILLPNLSITLLERSKRRSAFLKTCCVLLGLRRVTVVEAGLLDAAGAFDVLTFRAVFPLQRFVAELERSRVETRAVVAYKGRLHRAREEAAGVQSVFDARGADPSSETPRRSIEVLPVRVPFLEEERCVAVLRRAYP